MRASPVRPLRRWTTALATVAASLTSAPAAHAQSTCSFDDVSGVLEVTTPTAPGTAQTYVGRVGDAITLNGNACGAATVTATDIVLITNRLNDGDVVLDLRNGRLAPGRTTESDGASEIEVRLAGEAIHQLTLMLAGGDDEVRLWTAKVSGAWLANLTPGVDRDADASLEPRAVESVVVVTGSGNDSVQSLGFRGHRDPTAGTVWFVAGPGSDRLLLGPMRPSTASYGGFAFAPGGGADVLDLSRLPKVWEIASNGSFPFAVSVDGDQPVARIIGHRGVDTLWSTAAGQRLIGLAGQDALHGRGGRDMVVGGPGADAVSGGKGADYLSGGPGSDAVDGGRGVDRCRIGGRDTATSCEIQI